MFIKKGTALYQQLYTTLAQRPGLDASNARYINRYLEVKQIDWALWYEFSGSILDIACHIPLDAVILNQMPDVKHIHLIDLRLLPPTISLPSKASFLQSDATKLAFPDNAFDVVMSFSAIEHVPDRELQRIWVKEMVRVTKPGGKLLVTVDNAWSWLNRVWDSYRPPMRRLNPRELREWITESGNMDIEAKTGGALYYWGFRPPGRVSAQVAYLIDRILNPLSPFFPFLGNRIGYRFRKH